jgi:histidinol phosphatase-like PHP family hydrolase
MFKPETVAQFDYVFTDSMTWTDDNGRRMRTWMPNEVGPISDPQAFMEMLVKRAVGILEREPVDIYVNPTFIPDSIAARYDELWTEERMRKVIAAARKNEVALEINDRYKLPGKKFLRLAKEEGLKFTFGTNNGGANDLRRCDYGLEVTRELGLKWQDFFVPRKQGQKPVELRGLPKG